MDAADPDRDREVLAWLAAPTDAERRARLLQPDRSDVIAAGVLIVREVLLHLGLDRIAPSDRDLLDGVALEAAALPADRRRRPAGRLYLLLTSNICARNFLCYDACVIKYLGGSAMSTTIETQTGIPPAPGRRTPSTPASPSRFPTRSRRSAARSPTSTRRSPTASSPAPRASRASRPRKRTSRPTCSHPSSSTPSGTRRRLLRRAPARRRRGRDRRRDHAQGHHAAGRPQGHDRRPRGRPLRRDPRRAEARDHRRPHEVRHELEHAAPERRAGALQRGHPQG